MMSVWMQSWCISMKIHRSTLLSTHWREVFATNKDKRKQTEPGRGKKSNITRLWMMDDLKSPPQLNWSELQMGLFSSYSALHHRHPKMKIHNGKKMKMNTWLSCQMDQAGEDKELKSSFEAPTSWKRDMPCYDFLRNQNNSPIQAILESQVDIATKLTLVHDSTQSQGKQQRQQE